MRKWKLWLLLGSSSFLVFFLLLVATAAGSFADDVTAAFGGRQASASESRTPIKATYVGVDDTDTDFSGCVIPETRRWSNQHGAFENGYAGYCELWCKVVYTYAGLPYEGFCCAYSHGAAMANRDGPIPKGALIFSGVIPGTGKTTTVPAPSAPPAVTMPVMSPSM